MEPTLPQKPFISSVEAGKRFDITNDYVGALCRRGKVRGALVGRLWFVDEQALDEYLKAMQAQRSARRELLSKAMSHAWTLALLIAVLGMPGARAEAAGPANALARVPDSAINTTYAIELAVGQAYWSVIETFVDSSATALDAASNAYIGALQAFVDSTYAARDLAAVAYGGIAQEVFTSIAAVHSTQMAGIALMGSSMADGAQEMGGAYQALAQWYARGAARASARLAPVTPVAAVVKALSAKTVADAASFVVASKSTSSPAPIASAIQPLAATSTATTSPYVTQDYLAQQLALIRDELHRISAQGVSTPPTGPALPPEVAASGWGGATFGAAAAPPPTPEQFFEKLTAADMPTDIVAANYLPLTGGTLSGSFTVGSSTLAVLTSGRVGLGTTSPTAMLDLTQGSNGVPLFVARRATDTAPSGDFIDFNDAAGTTLFRVDNSGNLMAGGILNTGSQTITSVSAPQFRVQYDASNEMTTSVASNGVTTLSVNGTTPRLNFIPQNNALQSFDFTDASSTSVLSIDTLDSRVGIGTTSPTARFSVGGDSYFGGNLSSTGTLAVQGTGTSTFSGNVSVTGNFNFNGQLMQNNAPFVASQWTTAGNDIYYTTGNVGIGTTSPGSALSVTGNALISGALTALGNVSLGNFNTDSTSACGNQYHAFIGSIGTVGGDECAALNVTQLDTNGNVIYRFGGAGQAWAGEFYANSSLVGMNTKGGLPLSFQLNGSEKFRLDSTGNIGIGTTSPWANLSLQATSGQSYPLLQIASTTGATTSSYLTVAAGGNVGVNTANPTDLFQVAGLGAPTLVNTTVISGGQPSSVYIQGNYMYVANYYQYAPYFLVYDITKPSAPVLVGSTNQGLTHAGSVVVQGRYAYINTQDALVIFDVSNPTKPTKVGSVSSDVTFINGSGQIAVSGHYAYVNSASGYVVIFDVSNPAAPVEVGKTSVKGGTIAVQGNYLYLTYGRSTLDVFDVSNPASPILAGSLNLSQADYVTVSGRYAYVTNDVGNGHLDVVDISDPTAPSLVVSLYNPSFGRDHVAVAGRYLYVQEYNFSNGSQIATFDISDPSNPLSVGTTTIPGKHRMTDIEASGRYIYLTDVDGSSVNIYQMGGAYIQALEAGTLKASDAQLNGKLFAWDGIFGGGLSVSNSLNVNGTGNFLSLATTTALGQPAALSASNVETNATGISDVLNLFHIGTSTASNGFGTRLLFSASACALSNCYAATSTATTTSGIASIFTSVSTTSPTADLAFYTKASSAGLTEGMRLTSAGFLGIGTTTPTYVFDAYSTNSVVGRFDGSSASGAFLEFNNAGTSTKFTAIGEVGDDFAINTSGTRRLTITSTGSVGIGTTPTSRALDVNGSVLFRGASGGTTCPAVVTACINFTGAGTQYGLTFAPGSDSSTDVQFLNAAGTQVGSISETSSATAYNTTSDRRLKENIATSSTGLATLLEIPVRNFDFISDPSHAQTQGFIAQELYQFYPYAVTKTDNGIDPLTASSTPWSVDYGRLSPLLVKSIQDLNSKVDLSFSALVGSSTASTTDSQSLASEFFSNLFGKVSAWLADAANGIHDLYAMVIHATEVHTKELCVEKSDGTEVCVTGDQLDSLLAGAVAGATAQNSASTASSTTTDATSTADTQPPVVTILGSTTVTIDVNSSYIDLGASVTDNVNKNLGYKVSLDGGATTSPDQLTLDTSVAGTHIITFSATDQAGNVGYATRTVIMGNPQPVQQDTATSTPATSTPPTSTTSTDTTIVATPDATSTLATSTSQI